MTYTPNANMADHSVGARDESNGSEASEALMFCRPSVPFYFTVPTSCCVSECDRRDRNLPPFTSKGQ